MIFCFEGTGTTKVGHCEHTLTETKAPSWEKYKQNSLYLLNQIMDLLLPFQEPRAMVEESSLRHWTVGVGCPEAAHRSLTLSLSFTEMGPPANIESPPENIVEFFSCFWLLGQLLCTILVCLYDLLRSSLCCRLFCQQLTTVNVDCCWRRSKLALTPISSLNTGHIMTVSHSKTSPFKVPEVRCWVHARLGLFVDSPGILQRMIFQDLTIQTHS